MSCRNSSAVSDVCRSPGEVALDPLLLLAPERRIGEDDVHPLLLADLRQLEPQRIPRIDLRRIEPVQQQVHLAQQVRQRLGLAADDRGLLQHAPLLHRLDLRRQVRERLDQEPTRAGRRIEHRLPELRVDEIHHQPHHRPRRVELARVPGRVAHFPQHRLVQSAQRVQLVAGREMNPGDLVDDVAQQVTALHAVIDALEYRRDHVPAVIAVRAGEASQVCEQSRPFGAIGPRGLVLVDERE